MTLSIDTHIESTPDIRNGRAHLSGTRISVDDVVIMYVYLHQSVEEIVADYGLSPAAVHASLAYYYDHKMEIDNLITRDDAFHDEFVKSHPSKFLEKLKAMGRA